MKTERTYIAIDLKSFYASVECVGRGLDPLTTNLVVADKSRTEKTICLAVSPSMKAYGIPGRARLFEVVQRVWEVNAQRMRKVGRQKGVGKSVLDTELMSNPDWEVDYIVAPPRMAFYIEYSTRIYQIYLKYVAPEDIHVYSIDEVFMDVTSYLASLKMTAHELARVIIDDVLRQTGITATAGIGTNLYLSKVAMDIVAKHIPADENGVRIAWLDEMEYRRKLWQHRPLTDFWRQRDEAEFTGVDDIPVRFVRFRAQHHDRVVVICPGRIESYVKYAELAYDLFHLGFDVLIIDHRGQGRSGRLLADPHLGHVNRFNDYVDDLAAFWQQEVQPGPWRKRYILAHSMGGAISTLFLQRHPGVCGAIALTAPMFGIVIRMPSFMARQILNWAEAHPRFRDGYAIGTGRWRALPFAINVLTHSRQRYRRNLRFYADDPTIRVGGPTYHWVRESILAGEQVLAGAGDDATPTLLLQAEEERVVDNRMHDRFCELRTAAGHPVEGGRPLVIKGAYHEILFEKDAMRSVALHAIVDFFNRHNSPSGNRSTEV